MTKDHELWVNRVVHDSHTSVYTGHYDISGEEVVIDILPDGTLTDGGFRLSQLEVDGHSGESIKKHAETYGLAVIADEIRLLDKVEDNKASLKRYTESILSLFREMNQEKEGWK